jgi:hypothetical protein
VSLQTKFLIPSLWIALLLCSLIFGPRQLIRRPALWLGGAIAALVTVPTLLWQQHHDWVYTKMSGVVAAESPSTGGFLWDSASGAGLAVGLPLVLIGLWVLLTRAEFRIYRFAGVAMVLVFVAFVAMSGRSYYTCSIYALPMAAGAVAVASLLRHRPVRIAVGAAVTAGAVMLVAAVAVYPRSWAEKIPQTSAFLTAKAFVYSDTLTSDLVAPVAAAYDALPPEQKSDTVIVAESYPLAAALDLDRPRNDLPRAHSAHRGYYYFGSPADDQVDVMYLGDPKQKMADAFASSQPMIPDLATLYVGRKESWQQLWPQLRDW